ncbi:MAG: iron-sulfur cluster assembly scaffold protein [Pseudomonadota bacterium]
MSGALYHETLMALARSGCGAARLQCPDASVRIDNPLCGDEITLDLHVNAAVVSAIGHRVRGCALCEASAAWLTRYGTGQDFDALRDIYVRMQSLLSTGEMPERAWAEMEAFAPVHAARSRHRCVLLPLEAAVAALSELT